MNADMQRLVRISSIMVIITDTILSYITIFVVKYVINTNDTDFIGAVSLVASLSILGTNIVMSNKEVRYKFSSKSSLMLILILETVVLSVLLHMVTGDVKHMTVVWMIPTSVFSVITMFLFNDRNMAIYQGDVLIKRNTTINNWKIVSGLIGSSMAIFISLEDLQWISTIVIVTLFIDMLICLYYVNEIHKYMNKYNLKVCSKE